MATTLEVKGMRGGGTAAPANRKLSVHALAAGAEPEVLAFLAGRPLHTAIMAGFVLDNGLASPLNRGTFYACRDAAGRLAGVALIGHHTLVEARGDAALDAFGELARSLPRPHVIMGEERVVARFWSGLAPGGERPRLSCRELLFEQRAPAPARAPVGGLRLAVRSDLEAVAEAQARLAFDECGINPLAADAEGFRRRCLRRIERGRVWVLTRAGRLVFKADVISETPEVIYLEGVHVAPESRGQGLGLDCLTQLGRVLLERARALCLLVNEARTEAHDFYRRAGYEFRGYYETIYPGR